MKTLYVYPSSGIDTDFTLIDIESGEALAGHLCSHEGFAKSDLYYGRPERIEKLKEKYNDEIEVKFFNQQDEVTDEEMFRRNKEFYEKEEK